MNKDKLLQIVSDKLADLKSDLCQCSSGLSLEEYDLLYGDIEELQCFVGELQDN